MSDIEQLRATKAHKETVLKIREKREFLARVVRCRVFTEPPESDVWDSVKHTEHGLEMKLPSKIAAIKADNDLAGEGSEAEGYNALTEMLRRRLFLARIVRATPSEMAALEAEMPDDLWGKARMPNKLEAIVLDNDLAGHGARAQLRPA